MSLRTITDGWKTTTNPRYIHLKSKLEYLSKELKRVEVTKKLLWEEYIQIFPQATPTPSSALS